MAGSGASQHNLRKAIGVLKDTTTVGFVKVNSDYKELDVAIVKATNHVEQLPKEKHIRTILESVSASRPRADVAYCINSLAKRLAKTHNWAVALKTLMVIHRALREVDASFRGELVKYSRSGHILNLSHFKDDSSPDGEGSRQLEEGGKGWPRCGKWLAGGRQWPGGRRPERAGGEAAEVLGGNR
ncbi:Putative clathrin assembly protein [Dendrobium catenatum]|uniref:Clathrin assembly protein n=1 Tax=Dendrobium catenatum TaxID=906689 RepID=A0A2I0WHZ3_9ASPA|nr:Putative clathrin assembly protein [Dendrobium catenatum]